LSEKIRFIPKEIELEDIEKVENSLFSGEMPYLGDCAFGQRKSKITIIFIHGFTGSSRELNYISNYVATYGFRVLVPLLPGHGTNYKDLKSKRYTDWIKKIYETYQYAIENYSNSEIVLMGHSLGGVLATYYLLNYPQQVSKLILIASPIRFPWHYPIIARLGRWFNIHIPYDVFHFNDERLHSHPLKELYIDTYGKVALLSIDEIFRVIRSNYEKLNTLILPILGIYAKNDYRIPNFNRLEIKKILGNNFKLIELENSNHIIMVDSDRKVAAEAILNFLNAK
jgi:carboxylesterase